MKKLVLAALLVATPAVAADQLDLVCTAKKETQHYRIDLARMVYCAGNCDRVMAIAEVSPALITLSKTVPKFRNDAEGWNRIDRSTGEWSWYFVYPANSSSVQDIKGTCQPADFSGMPQQKF